VLFLLRLRAAVYQRTGQRRGLISASLEKSESIKKRFRRRIAPLLEAPGIRTPSTVTETTSFSFLAQANAKERVH